MYWLLLLCFLPDGELVLRNGKVLRYQGEYAQEGQWVRFTDHDGKYLQLPSKIVDFEKTQARIEGQKVKAAADEDAKRAAAFAKIEEEDRKKASIIGVADLVGDDSMGARELSINDKGLDEQERVRNGTSYDRYSYYDDYRNDSYDDTFVETKAKMKDALVRRYKTLKRFEKSLNAEVVRQRAVAEKAKRAKKRSNRDEGTDVESSSSDAATRANERVRELEAELSRIKGKVRELERLAENAGIYDLR